MNKFKSSSLGLRVAGFASIGLAVIAITPASLLATPIPFTSGGVLLKSNQTGDLLAVTSSSPCIAFSGAAICAGSGTTPFLVSGQDPIFSTTTSGLIKDIGTTFPITAFETVGLTSGGPAIFDLLNIIAPNSLLPPCAPGLAACSTGTFSLLQQTDNSVAINLALNEIGYVGSSSTGFNSYKGLFSTTITGDLKDYTTGGACTGVVTIASILDCEGKGKTIRSTWSGTQSPVSGVPEPMSFSLVGAGLLGLGLSRRRKQT